MSLTIPTPTTEQEARAKWDLLLLDLETRAEQVRQMKAFPSGTYEGWKLAFGGMAAGGTLVAGAVAAIAFVLHLTGKL